VRNVLLLPRANMQEFAASSQGKVRIFFARAGFEDIRRSLYFSPISPLPARPRPTVAVANSPTHAGPTAVGGAAF